MPLGYEECDLKVYLDYPQERQNQAGPFVFATDGTQIDTSSLEDCIIDPATLSVFGKPLPMTAEWNTTTSGNYYRYQKSDFTFTSTNFGNDWSYNDVKLAGNTYIYSISSVSYDQASPIYLTNDIVRNEAFFFSYSKLAKKSSSKVPMVILKFENETNRDKDIQLHFMQDGGCDVYRGYVLLPGTITTSTSSTTVTGKNTLFTDTTFGLLVGSPLYDKFGRLLGYVQTIASNTSLTLAANASHTIVNGDYSTFTPNKVQSYSRTESNYSQGRPITTVINPNDQFNDVYIIPCRGRDLMVLTSYGLNFSHTFADLGSGDIFPDQPNDITNYDNSNYSRIPIIIPNGKLSIQIPEGKLSFQLAKLYFKSNWSCFSQVIKTPTIPPATITGPTGTISFNVFDNPKQVTGTGTSFLSVVPLQSLIGANLENNKTSLEESNIPVAYTIIGKVDTKTSDTLLTLEENVQYNGTDVPFVFYPRISGTISCDPNSNIVDGVGTSFLSDINLEDKIYLSDGSFIGTVDSVISNSQLTLEYPTPIPFGSAQFYKNLCEYSSTSLINFQKERFGNLNPTNIIPDLIPKIYTKNKSSVNVFNNVNQEFRIKFTHTTTTTTSTDYGVMLYSCDILSLLNNKLTSESTVEIQSAIQEINISRNESGALSLSFTARKKLLEDLGYVNSQKQSNVSVRVAFQPRRYLNTGTISKGASDVLTGVGTFFTDEVSIGEAIYFDTGEYIGRVYSIESDTSLTLFAQIPDEFVGYNWSINPIYREFNVFEGYLNSPDIEYLQSGPLPDTYDEYSLLSFEAIDKKEKLNTCYFSVAPNFDNTTLFTSTALSLALSGQNPNDFNKFVLTASPSIETYPVPINRNNSNGQYNFIINLGDTSGSYIEKLRSDYAQNFTFFCQGGWWGKYNTQNGYYNYSVFNLTDLDYVSKVQKTNAFVDLYLNEQQAFDYGLIPIYYSYKRTIRNLKKTYESPEANRIIITGLDKSDGSKIETILNNLPSQNPTTPPASRPQNWLGDIYPFVMINDKLNSKSDTIQVAEQYYNKITTGREIVEFDSDFLTYFDSNSNLIPQYQMDNHPLSGTIAFSEGDTFVYGASTLFTTELEVGDTIYDNYGNIIGVVVFITNDTELEMINPATFTRTDIPFNNFTVYLNEFDYLDIGDTVDLVDQNNVKSTYKIIDWSLQCLREHIDPGFNVPNIRVCKYRAKKISIPENAPLFIDANYVEPVLNQKIITAEQTLDVRVYIVNYDPNLFDIYTATLTGNPTGMTVSLILDDSGAYANILWTPTTLQANKIYDGINISISDGSTSKSYTFSVRVYPV